jgi:hypothetical protein
MNRVFVQGWFLGAMMPLIVVPLKSTGGENMNQAEFDTVQVGDVLIRDGKHEKWGRVIQKFKNSCVLILFNRNCIRWEAIELSRWEKYRGRDDKTNL